MTNRLLIFCRSHVPHGGADRIIADLCRGLPGQGWDVTLGLTKGGRFNDPDRYRAVQGDLPTIDVDGNPGTRHARLAALHRVLRRVRPDVVLTMRVFDALEAVARVKSERGPRLAMGIRAFESGYLGDLRMYRDHVDLCVTSGRLIAAACRDECGVEPERVASIAGGVHPPLVAAVPRRPRKPLRLLYAGRLDQEQKRILDLVGFVEELKRLGIEFELDLAGVGTEQESLRERLDAHSRDCRVRFHGWLSREELYRSLYPKADCFVHFAAWEGVTIAPREAMAHGAIPIVSRFVGLKTEGLFRDGENALTFGVGDVVGAACCIRRLIEEPTLMERLSTEAMQSQQGEYSFQGTLRAWAEAFERCLTLPVRRGPIPRIASKTSGRLARWVVLGESWQTRLRRLLRRPVQHQSPGSEWPTHSGLLTASERERLDRFADRLEGK